MNEEVIIITSNLAHIPFYRLALLTLCVLFSIYIAQPYILDNCIFTAQFEFRLKKNTCSTKDQKKPTHSGHFEIQFSFILSRKKSSMF